MRYGHGFNPLGSPTDTDLEKLRAALADAGRDLGELELVGGTRGRFPGPDGVADLDEALAAIPGQVARGFTSICIKPSQFIDDPREFGALVPEGRGPSRGVRVNAWAGRGPGPYEPSKARRPGWGIGPPTRPWPERAG